VDEGPKPPDVDPSVWIVRADRAESDELKAAMVHLGLSDPRPVLILVGGAANVAEAVEVELLRLFEHLAPLLDRLGAAVVDGGTAFGVMSAMGRARRRAGAGFPLLGVAPQGRVAIGRCPADGLPGSGNKARLDPDHTHFLLVPGERWGDESPWINAAAACMAGGRATLMLVAAGGAITLVDVMHRLGAGGPVLVLAGSGGTADRLADWRRTGRGSADFEPGETGRALIEVLSLADAPGQLPGILERAFTP
jgi:hypothetical protein